MEGAGQQWGSVRLLALGGANYEGGIDVSTIFIARLEKTTVYS
jgi:hypothetical protein